MSALDEIEHDIRTTGRDSSLSHDLHTAPLGLYGSYPAALKGHNNQATVRHCTAPAQARADSVRVDFRRESCQGATRRVASRRRRRNRPQPARTFEYENSGREPHSPGGDAAPRRESPAGQLLLKAADSVRSRCGRSATRLLRTVGRGPATQPACAYQETAAVPNDAPNGPAWSSPQPSMYYVSRLGWTLTSRPSCEDSSPQTARLSCPANRLPMCPGLCAGMASWSTPSCENLRFPDAARQDRSSSAQLFVAVERKIHPEPCMQQL